MKIFQGMLAAGLLASTLYPWQTEAVSPAQPLPPSNLAASSVSSSRLDLSWADHSFNETGFQLQFATNAAFASATSRNIGPNTTSYSHTGLGPIATLWYRIRAKRGALASAWSNTAFATTTPNGVGATAVSSSAIDVSWTPPYPANPNITGYTVRYGTAADSCNAIERVAGNGSTYSATGLLPGQTYYVSVRADGGAYSSAFSAPASTVTLAGLGTPISPLFFGQNAWLPIQIGDHPYGGDLEELLCGTSYASGGALVHGGVCVTDPPAAVQASGVKLMRYGGKGVDQYYDADQSMAQYLTMVDNMRANGIEPLLEVPWFDGADLEVSAEQAAELVRYINITNHPDHPDHLGVTYWTIANEPNAYASQLDASKTDIATYIANYFRAFAIAMRDVDPTIVIVGPDLSYYDSTIMDELTTPNGANDICGLMKNEDGSNYVGPDGNSHYYLDVIDFHRYPFSGDQTRAAVIAEPQCGFQNKLTAMKDRVDQCNSNSYYTRTGTLKMAVTEINVEHSHNAPLGLSGVSAQSFLAGQYWADVMNVGMQNGLEFVAFWSVKEGDPQLGYIASNGTKLPTYYHYQMLAKNFRGTYAAATRLKIDGYDEPNVKAFGAKDSDQIVVMLLNEKQAPATPLGYTVRLETGTITPPPTGGYRALKVNINAGVNKQYSNPLKGELGAESTVMLVFDGSGNFRARHVYSLSRASVPPTEFRY